MPRNRTCYPDLYVDSAYTIDYESLYADGYRGLIFDIDNTLVTHGAPATPRAVALFARLREIGFVCCFISNNGEARVQMFNEDIHAQYVYKAHKPAPDGYRRGMEMLGTDADTTVCIGDQIFTDVRGARLAGIPVIMVRSIWWWEKAQIFFKRVPEVFVLLGYRHYRKQHPTAVRGAYFAKGDAVSRYLFRGHARTAEDKEYRRKSTNGGESE